MVLTKRKLMLLGVLFFLMFALSFSNNKPQINAQINETNNKSNNTKNDLILPIETPKISDGQTDYTYNRYCVVNETFDNSGDINKWEWNETGGATVEVTGGELHFSGDNPGSLANREYACTKYDLDIIPIYEGNLSFSYRIIQSALGIARVLVDVYDGSWHKNIWNDQGSTSGYEFVELSLSSYDTTAPDFSFRFNFTGEYTGDDVYIDNVNITANEFQWQEQSDPIEPTASQQITTFIAPSFKGLDSSNVTLKWSVNDPTLSSATDNQFTPSGLYYFIQIPQTVYKSGDIFYYQIWISNTTHTIYKNTPTFNFQCYDRRAPVITNVQNNATTYYNDLEISCHVKDDVHLENVTMYIDFGNTADMGDKLIQSNQSASIPTPEGDFKFVIDEKFLSARSGRELNYIIYAKDGTGNTSYTSGILFFNDDVKPFVQFYKHYAPAQGIENNESLVVSFIATEPTNGSGLADLRLFVKISDNLAPPIDSNDYNYTIIGPDGGIGDESGGIYNFTIPESYYNYSQYIYFFMNATDNDGNMNSTFELPFPNSLRVRSNDTIAPEVLNYSSNGLDAIYNVSKTLTFEITEPSGASGINNDSLVLYYWIGGSGSMNKINSTIIKYGGDIDFIIDHTLYNYGDIVYYQLNVSDDAGNKYTSGNGTFFVGDPYAPSITFLKLHNITIIKYYDDFNISFEIKEDISGSGVSNIELWIKNQTDGWGSANKVYKMNVTKPFSSIGCNISFEINSTSLSARERLDWRLTATDNANSQGNKYGSIYIHDDIAPNAIYDKTNDTLNQFEYYQDVAVYYQISEPLGGSGFTTNKDNLRLCYKIGGASIDSSDNNDYILPSNISILPFTGRYMFVLPENLLVYDDGIIEFWLNCTDKHGNLYTTWSARQSIQITDNVDPTITMYAQNSIDVSYHQNKIIHFDAFETSDSSGLKNATLYWRINSAPTINNNDGSYTYTFIPGQDSYIDLQMILNRFNLQYIYNDEVFILIDVYDIAGNNGTSILNSFDIIDTVDPSFQANTDNTNGWTWRVNRFLNFTVYDPDYSNSSGIAYAVVYYKAGNDPTENDYNGKVFAEEVISLSLKEYSFNITLNESLYLIDNHIYYFIQIRDVAGNEINSSVSFFIIHNDVFIPNSVIGPEQNEWLDTGDVDFFIDLYFETNMWIIINGELYQKSLATTRFDDIISLEEGDYLVQFKFLDNNSNLEFIFSIDIYAPEKITEISFSIYGYEVVEIKWDDPLGIDEKTIYKIYKSTDPDFKINNNLLLAEIKANEKTTYEDTDIKAGTTYYYKIVAVDRVGHESEVSDALKVEVPLNPVGYILPIVILVAAILAIGLVTKKKITAKRRAELFSKVDLKELDDKYALDLEEIKPNKGPEWTEITTKAAPKPVVAVEHGFQFTETPKSSGIGLTGYWEVTLANLLDTATQAELSNNYSEVIRIYNILIRISKKIQNHILTSMLESKKKDIFNRIS
ncbi:MAG: hypothetical protein ACTSR8_01605 [Promethearchaeota archaeon]